MDNLMAMDAWLIRRLAVFTGGLLACSVLATPSHAQTAAAPVVLFKDNFDDCYGRFPSERWELVSSGAMESCLGGSCGPGPESCLSMKSSAAASRAKHTFSSSSSLLSLSIVLRIRDTSPGDSNIIGILGNAGPTESMLVGARFDHEDRDVFALDGTFLGRRPDKGYMTIRFDWDRSAGTYDIRTDGGKLIAAGIPASGRGESDSMAIVLEVGPSESLAEYDYVELRHAPLAPAPNRPPTASFAYTFGDDFASRRKVSFDASSSADPDGSITKLNWEFGDGETYETSERSIWHVYASDGQYRVNLKVRDNSGGEASTSQVITVNVPSTSSAKDSPLARFTYTYGDEPGEFVFYSSDSTSEHGGIGRYDWNFGDGQIESTSLLATRHVFASSGTYYVTLKVTDMVGLTDSMTQMVMVSRGEATSAPSFQPDANPGPIDDDSVIPSPGIAAVLAMTALAFAVRRR